MRQFVYFVPDVVFGSENQQEQIFDAAGLSDRFPGGRAARLAGKGPNDKQGFFFARESIGCKYRPDEQTWSGPFGTGGYWIGFRTDAPPGPGDLARGEQVNGSIRELQDGNAWLIPCARLAPTGFVVVENKLQIQSLEKHQRLWAHVEWLCDRFNKDTGVFELDVAEPDEGSDSAEARNAAMVKFIERASDILATNYLVSADPNQETSALRLFTSDNLFGIFFALMDMGAEKKTD